MILQVREDFSDAIPRSWIVPIAEQDPDNCMGVEAVESLGGAKEHTTTPNLGDTYRRRYLVGNKATCRLVIPYLVSVQSNFGRIH